MGQRSLVKSKPTYEILYLEHLEQGGEPIYYHGPHELCIIAGGTQNQLIFGKILPLSSYGEE